MGFWLNQTFLGQKERQFFIFFTFLLFCSIIQKELLYFYTFSPFSVQSLCIFREYAYSVLMNWGIAKSIQLSSEHTLQVFKLTSKTRRFQSSFIYRMLSPNTPKVFYRTRRMLLKNISVKGENSMSILSYMEIMPINIKSSLSRRIFVLNQN